MAAFRPLAYYRLWRTIAAPVAAFRSLAYYRLWVMVPYDLPLFSKQKVVPSPGPQRQRHESRRSLCRWVLVTYDPHLFSQQLGAFSSCPRHQKPCAAYCRRISQHEARPAAPACALAREPLAQAWGCLSTCLKMEMKLSRVMHCAQEACCAPE